jgi:hypothetical protein
MRYREDTTAIKVSKQRENEPRLDQTFEEITLIARSTPKQVILCGASVSSFDCT